MSLDPLALNAVLRENYAIHATPIEGLEHFDYNNVKVYSKFPDEFTIENYGAFDIQRLEADNDELYKLVICSTDFPNNERLAEAMTDEEYLTVKEYELIKPKTPISGYFLYKLIPFTVQSKPVWS